jgi:outer membrane autotransporter protein
MVMKINRSTLSPCFRKTLLASLLLPLFSPLYSWAAQTASVTDGSTMAIHGDYNTQNDNDTAVLAQGPGSTINGGADVNIETTGRNGIGAYALDGGVLNLNGATITTGGAVALGIQNNKGTVNLQGGTITTNGQTAYGIYSSGLGSITNINGAEITTTNTSAHAIYGGAGTELILNNTTVNTNSGSSYGIYLTGADTTLTGANNIINSTNAAGGAGIYIGSGGVNATLDNTTINIANGANGVFVGQGSSITMDGLIATGNITNLFRVNGNATVSNANIDLASGGLLLAQGTNASNKSVIVLNNVDVVSNGGSTTLVDINKDADVTVNGGSYHSKGNNAVGMWVRDNTSSLNVKNAVIITEGSNATAIENRGTAIVDNSMVITKGNSSHALYSEQSLDATNMAISTAGTGSIGAAAARGGNLNLDNAIIETTGNSGMVLGSFSRSSINAKNVFGTSTGANAHALWLQEGSSILLEDSQITTEGLSASGIYATNTGTGAGYSHVTLNNSQIISEQGPGIQAFGADINVDVKNGSYLTGGNGLLVNASSNGGVASNVNVNGDNYAVLLGDLQADANNNVSLALTNNSVWTGAATNAKQVDIDSTSIWNLTGDADVESMHVLGQMNFISNGSNPNARASGYSFSTLTINNNLTGSGTLTFNTQLGDDSSPTDRLHVIGNASGDHNVVVINQGGLGGLTTGTGINLITIDGNTQSSSFTMNNSVSAGAYEYFLYQIDEHNWNLLSNLNNPDPGTGPGPYPEGEVAYRPEVPGYVGAPWLNAFYGFTTLGSLHERRGSAEGPADGFNEDSWGRIRGQHNNFDASRFSYDSNLWFMQLGHDVYQAENAAGTQVTGGMMVTIGQQNTNTQDQARAIRPDLSINTGKIKTKAYGFGGYYTLMTQEGGYLDITSQATIYRNSYESQYNAKHTGYGVVMSAEVGQPYPLAGGWMVEPQGQLKYQYLHLSPKGFKDEISEISGIDYSVGQVRAGLRLFSDTTEKQGIKPYLTTDVVHQLGRNPQVAVANVDFRPDFTKTFWQGGAGVTAKVGSRVDIYADAKYQKSFDGKMDGYLGNLGVKVSF